MGMEKKALALCITLAISNSSFAAEENIYQNKEEMTARCADSANVNQENRCNPDDQTEEWIAAGI